MSDFKRNPQIADSKCNIDKFIIIIRNEYIELKTNISEITPFSLSAKQNWYQKLQYRMPSAPVTLFSSLQTSCRAKSSSLFFSRACWSHLQTLALVKQHRRAVVAIVLCCSETSEGPQNF